MEKVRKGSERELMRFKLFSVIFCVIYTVDCIASIYLILSGAGDASCYGRLIGLIIETILFLVYFKYKHKKKDEIDKTDQDTKTLRH